MLLLRTVFLYDDDYNVFLFVAVFVGLLFCLVVAVLVVCCRFLYALDMSNTEHVKGLMHGHDGGMTE
jgi:hypothetical protein